MAKNEGHKRRRLVYFVTEDWYFCSHRLQLAVAAKNAGFDVYVVTRVQAHGDEIKAAGLELIPLALSRRSKNPFVEAVIVGRLTKIYREIRPDIVHHVAIKPVIYGSIAARRARVPVVINAMAGLGFLFSSGQWLARVLRPIIRVVFKMLLNNKRTTVILQNPDDVDALCGGGTVSRDRVRLILGSGVDTDVYHFQPEAEGVPIVLLASRLLWDKGVGEFVEAARRIRADGVNVRFVIAGEGDDENPNSIGAVQLLKWSEEGVVECWGRCSNMPNVFEESHIVCLPTTYGEGVPKVLIEAASCGRPIVATNAPGCREIVIDGENGILVPTKDVDALVAAITDLLESPERRKAMGQAGRNLVEAQFSLDRVIGETLELYRTAQE